MRYHTCVLSSILFAALAGAPVLAEDVMLSSLGQTMESCIENSSGDLEQCIGEGAKTCREGLPHKSNAAMTDCIIDEFTFWERQLAIGQASQIVRAEKFEVDRAVIGAPSVDLIDMTRDALNAWRRHRDTSCDVELAYWVGGSGGESVVAQCKLETTAEQAIRLNFGDGWGGKQ
ncbi:MAG: lysozyme inhibitor LprI family protein [Litoreibacter sp.]|uniref:lysozyme inhibitor LprI family protein n=1 Tax=Litoreibacter sp. TaxID=1969459 RepID=UPI00329A6DB1